MHEPAKDQRQPKPTSLAGFNDLPDEARARIGVVCQLFDVGPATVWRRVKSGLIPPPIKDGRSTRWTVGSLRQALRK